MTKKKDISLKLLEYAQPNSDNEQFLNHYNEVIHLRKQLAEKELELSKNKIRMERVERLSTYDSLTQVLNERAFNNVGRRVMNEYKRGIISDVSMFYIDINDFTSINNEFGHSTGDDILREFSGNLEELLRKDMDIFGRLHGDEFGVLLKGTSLPDSIEIANRLYDNLNSRSYSIRGKSTPLTIGASIGISSTPHAKTYSQLKEFSDMALMKYAKPKKKLKLPSVASFEDNYLDQDTVSNID